MNQKYFIFYTIIVVLFLLILLTNPFLRYPYDMIHHLIVIDDFYTSLHRPIPKIIGLWVNDIYIMLPNGEETQPIILNNPRYIWHYSWAYLFYLLDIDSTQLLLRAKIIHIVQTVISLFCLYYFSKVVLRNTFKNIEEMRLKYLSLWAVLIWLTIFATASVAYQQIWMLWYSINYQITLPLFWYTTALVLVLMLEETSIWKKIFFIFQIMILSRIILQIHSMEFLYYLMYMLVFGIIYIDKVYVFVKKYFYLFIPIILAIGYFMKHYQPEHSKIFNYLSWEKFPALYDKIMYSGALLVGGYNRAFASINELMYFIVGISIVFILYISYRYYKKKPLEINVRMFFFVGITSLFVLIPLYQFSGGLFGMITHTMVVNRLYYSASLFLILPIVAYYFIQHYRVKLRYMHLILFLSLVSVYMVSKYTNMMNHNYYKNIQSIKNSFHERKVGFNLSQKQITTVGELISKYEKENTIGRKIKFYVRADIAFIIKYVYHKDVYWEGRSRNPDYKKIYEKNKNNQKFKHILFEVPKDFPIYRPFS